MRKEQALHCRRESGHSAARRFLLLTAQGARSSRLEKFAFQSRPKPPPARHESDSVMVQQSAIR